MLESKHREKSNRIEVHTPEILEEIIADNEIHSSIYRKVRSFVLNYHFNVSFTLVKYFSFHRYIY